MAVRRSARLRSRQASSEEPQLPVDSINNHNSHTSNEEQNNTTNTHNTLPSVMERDESPVVDTPPRSKAAAPSTSANIRTPLKSAPPQPKTATTPSVVVNHGTPLKATPSQKTPTQKTPSQKTPSQKTPAQKPAVAQTPTSVFTRPPHQEMHPSKVHQSTTKQADSGLILGFNPVKKDSEGKVVKESLGQDTPSKARPSPASTHFGTPGFEFKFSCHESQLSEEAKKLMETVREDAAKIKSQMTLDQKDDDAQKDDQQAADRRIAQPKGKTSRFSNAHMAEFKKMDSIAGHASAFRATPGRFQPVQKTLKRTTSKARLDDSDKNSPAKPTASKPAAASAPVPASASTKRVKHVRTDDTSTNRPAEEEPRTPSKPAQSRPRSTIRNSLMTPTAASAARSTYTSIKPPRASMIPSLARSPSLNQSTAPRTPRTDFNPRFKTNIPSLPALKSILRRPHQPLFSKDPSKIAAGTHVAAPDFDSKLLMGSSRDVSEDPVQTPSPKKRVEFSASTRSPADEASPSPSKAPAPAPQPTSDIVYPTLPVLTPEHAASKPANAEAKPSIRRVRPSDAAPASTPAPEVAGVPHGIGNKKRHRATDDETDSENVPPADPSSEARSTKRVKLSSPSPTKMPTPSPTKARTHTPLRSSSSASRSATPASARQRNRGVLSKSRLNMLAQPKNRS